MNQKIICPHYKKPCLEHGCTHYVQLLGNDPQTGEEHNNFICADLAQITIALEANKEIRQLAAAIESFRNEMVGQKLIIDVSKLTQLTKGIRHDEILDDVPTITGVDGSSL